MVDIVDTVDTEFWKEKKVFMTGATGFVGSWIAKSLIDMGAKLTLLVRDFTADSNYVRFKLADKATVVDGKLEDYDLLEKAIRQSGCDLVFHLAAQAIVLDANNSPLPTFETNIKGTWNVLEACRKCSIKAVIHSSSDKAYGTHEKLPYKEDYALCGLHPYDASKSCGDLLAQTYHNSYNLPVSVVRCANIYGAGDMNFTRIIPKLCKYLTQDKELEIRSDGTYIRDFIYIQDVVDAYLTLAEKLYTDPSVAGNAFNFGTGVPTSIVELIELLCNIAGKELTPIKHGEAHCEIKEQYLDCTKAKQLLNWSPKTDLKDGLKKTFDWYKAFLQKE